MQALVSWDDIDVDHSIKQHIIGLAVVGDLRWRDSAPHTKNWPTPG